MARAFYVHWHEAEAFETVRRLRAAGHTVEFHWDSGAEAWRLLKEAPPDALVISLARLPSHGRRVAEVVCASKRLRDLPIIFVDGEPDKVETTRAKFPAARFCTAAKLNGVLKRVRPFVAADPTAVRRATKSAAPLNAPGGPTAAPAGYSGTPLPQKLGIKPEHHVTLLNSPDGFERTLGTLPPKVQLQTKPGNAPASNVIVLFVRSRDQLSREFAATARRLVSNGGLWVAWPKKASGVETDLTEDVVRTIGLAAGLVDNKVCAVDQTWSGLRFVIRLKDRR
jgi:CheY-like chemotaxis protein